MATVRANKQPEGYLFAIVNSLDTVVQLGIKISAASHNSLNISLVYNDPSSNMPSESLAIFTLPYEPKHWINFAIQVLNDKVSLYNNCIKTQEINVTKEPKELVFESASTFYLAQSGNLRHRFEVSTVFFFESSLLEFVIEYFSWWENYSASLCIINCTCYSLLLFTRRTKTTSTRTHDACSVIRMSAGIVLSAKTNE